MLRRLGAGLFCPVCSTATAGFLPYNGRAGAGCPSCGVLERQRQLWVWLAHTGRLSPLRGAEVLHFAPEAGLAQALSEVIGSGYLTADLEPGAAMKVVDVTAMPFADETFDLVICSHVLEHVPDDRQAIRELRRVLKVGATALVTVPIIRDRTDEDPACQDPAERARRFGQSDHVRTYGWDFVDRLQDEGFDVDVVDIRSCLLPDERRRYGLDMSLAWLDRDAREIWALPVATKV